MGAVLFSVYKNKTIADIKLDIFSHLC